MRRRQRPTLPPSDDLSDEQAAALQRAVSPAGYRLDGPEFARCQEAATRLLALRWRRRQAEAFQGSATGRYGQPGQVESS